MKKTVKDVEREELMFSESQVVTWADALEQIKLTAGIEEGEVIAVFSLDQKRAKGWVTRKVNVIGVSL